MYRWGPEQDRRKKLSQIKETHIYTDKKVHRTSNRQDQKKPSPIYTKVKTLSIKNKERVMKAEKGKS